MKYIIFILTLFAVSNIHAQDPGRIFEAREIHFYGYDLSRVNLIEAKRIESYLLPEINGWIDFTNRRFNERNLSVFLEKERVSVHIIQAADRSIQRDGKKIAAWQPVKINQDTIQAIIRSYEFEEKEGVGYLAIPHYFEKSTKRVYVYHAWFDLSTKNILMLDYYMNKDADGYGLTQYWGNGLSANVKKYIVREYLGKQKKYNKYKKSP